MDPRIEFASIDAKDDSYTGYATVAFSSERGPLRRMNPHNSALQYAMEQDYLVSLHRLQEAIREKYLAQFDRTDPLMDSEDRSIKDHKRARELFPGPVAHYYT